jgi:hypothetical protein
LHHHFSAPLLERKQLIRIKYLISDVFFEVALWATAVGKNDTKSGFAINGTSVNQLQGGV